MSQPSQPLPEQDGSAPHVCPICQATSTDVRSSTPPVQQSATIVGQPNDADEAIELAINFLDPVSDGGFLMLRKDRLRNGRVRLAVKRGNRVHLDLVYSIRDYAPHRKRKSGQ
jgi:hypothetical protein